MDLIDTLEQNQSGLQQQSSNFTKYAFSRQNIQNEAISQMTEIDIIDNQIVLPSFQKDQFYNKTTFQRRFIKIIKTQKNVFRVFVTFDSRKKQLFIELLPFVQSQNTLQISYSSALHLISLFSKLNSSSNSYFFLIHPDTLQITINIGILLFSKNIDNFQIHSLINQGCHVFERNLFHINMFINGDYFLNNKSIALGESALKCITIVSEILSHSCKALDEIATTRDQKEDYKGQEQNQQQEKIIMKLPEIQKTICVSKRLLKAQISHKDIQKLLAPQKQIGNKTINCLCNQIKIKDSQNLKWVTFTQNYNTNIQVADADIVFKDHAGDFKRSIIRKKPKTQNGQKQYHNIKNIYQKIKQRNCINILKSYIVKQSKNKEIIYSDYCRYGSLSNYIKNNKITLTLKTKLYFLLQIATGLQFLKSERLIHMDIKPSNILVASDLWVKITDFGSTISQGDSQLKGWTAPYVSTQVLMNKNIDTKSDIYSFGVIAYQILTQKLLFPRRACSMDTFQHSNIESRIHPQSLFHQGPAEIMFFLYYLIIQCVNPVKKLRLSVQQLILVLKSLIGLVQYLLISTNQT